MTRETRICSVDGCDLEHRSLGYCEKHYLQFRRTGDPVSGKVARGRPPREPQRCSVENCDRYVKAHGVCSKHYFNLRRCGNPLGATKRTTRGAASRHPLFRTWQGMHRRCEDPGAKGYENYGGRGISVCERWGDFWNFADDMGPKPSANHSIDREEVDGNYEPGNCRWATSKEQGWNRRCVTLDAAKRDEIRRLRGTLSARKIAKQIGVRYDGVLNFLKGEKKEAPEFIPAPTVTVEELKFKPVTASICEVDGCDRIVQADGLCRKHWRRKYESSTLAQVVDKFATRQCKGCGCDLPDHARPDLLFCTLTCKMKFYRREGCYAPDKLLEGRGKCTVEGCEKPQHGKQVCRAHYMKKWHADKAAAKPG